MADTFAFALEQPLGIGQFSSTIEAKIHVLRVSHDMCESILHAASKCVVKGNGIFDVMNKFRGICGFLKNQVTQG